MDGLETNAITRRALDRFAVVSLVKVRLAQGLSLARAVKEVAALEHLGLDGTLSSYTPRCIYRWVSRFKKRGILGLNDRERKKIATSRVLPPKLVELLVCEKMKDATTSIPEIIRRARQSGVIAKDLEICRETVWRTAVRMNLPIANEQRPKNYAARPFEMPHRMMLVLADGKYFKVGPNELERVALVLLDDSTRYGLGATVGYSECTTLFLRALFKAIMRHGLMDVIYFDKGPGFRSDDTLRVCAALGITVVHGRTAYPPGRGKIERFNRTFKGELLESLHNNPTIDPDPAALEILVDHYVTRTYNNERHDNETCPAERFLADTLPLRFPESEEELRQKFILEEERRVDGANTIGVDGVRLEVPLGYLGRRVKIYRNVLSGDVQFLHETKLIKLFPTDKHKNAVSGRAAPQEESPPPPIPSTSAALMAFMKDMRPVVDVDGGFTDLED